jgi:hypothetical protein
MSAPPDRITTPHPRQYREEENEFPEKPELPPCIVRWFRGFHLHREKPKWTDICTALLTLFVAVAAFGSAWIFQEQLTEARKARIAEERAWIDPESMVLGSALENGLPVKYQIRIVNPGKEPAIGVVWKATPVSVPYIERNSNFDINKIGRNAACDGLISTAPDGTVLYPQSGVNFWLPLDIPNTVENRQLIKDVLNKKKSLVIDGCFAYTTIGEKHLSWFRFFLRDLPNVSSYVLNGTGQSTPAWNFNEMSTGNGTDQ